MYQTVLQHYGVKGMKWGVRRFQNKDGSLTYEGKYRIRQERASKTMDDIDEIIRTMPEEDKKKIRN